MASESREDSAVGVDVPADLDEWLDEQAGTLGVAREQLVTQILSSYHAAATLEGPLDATELLDLGATDFVDVEETVSMSVDEQVDDRLDGLVQERVDEAVEARVEQAVDDRIDDRLDDIESEFQEKITDVRERVIQVKQEADGKAPKAHTHDELAAVDALDARVNDLAASLKTLREDTSDRLDKVENGIEDQEQAAADLTERLEEASEKLNRVAWVVSDLKEEVAGRDAHEQAVNRIRRAAAQEDVSAAKCERCDENVQIGLLNEPECPHCQAAVSDVRPGGGFLRKKARLVAAAQLESGEDLDA